MGHNVHAKTTAPAGDWTLITSVAPAWMTALDTQAFQSINGDLGGTWAPAATIIVAGAGLTVSGLFQATSVNELDITGQILVGNAADIEFLNGSTCAFDSGSTCTHASGSVTTFASGSSLTAVSGCTIALSFNAASSITQIAGSTFTYGGTVNFTGPTTFAGTSWPLLSSRSVLRAIPMRVDWGTVVTTHAAATASNQQFCACNSSLGIRTDVLADNNDFFRIIIPSGSVLADGNVLASVTVAFNNAGVLTSGTRFNVVKVDVNGAETTIGSIQTSTLPIGAGTVTVTVGATIDLVNYVYKIFVQCPLPAGNIVTLTGAFTTCTVTQMRT